MHKIKVAWKVRESAKITLIIVKGLLKVFNTNFKHFCKMQISLAKGQHSAILRSPVTIQQVTVLCTFSSLRVPFQK